MALGSEVALALLIVGILMVLAELASPGAFILVPATALIVLGGIGMIYPDWLLSAYSPIAAVIIMVPMVFVTMKMYQKLAPPAPDGPPGKHDRRALRALRGR
jgi:membrane protein implicated in regulation of membrane protease activity